MRTLLLTVMVLTACAADPAQQAIEECKTSAGDCSSAAKKLCSLGAAGQAAVDNAVPDVQGASARLKTMVFEHARCSVSGKAMDPPSKELVTRLVATLDSSRRAESLVRRARLGEFGPVIHFHVFAAAAAAGISFDQPPAAPTEAAFAPVWCAEVLPVLVKQAPDSIRHLSRMLAVDCGAATDAAITTVATQVRAGRALRLGSLWVALENRIGDKEKAWRWIAPVFAANLACRAIGTVELQSALDSGQWSREGHRGLAKAVAKFTTRCPDDSTGWWSIVLRRLGAESGPLASALFQVGVACSHVKARLKTLRGIAEPSKVKPGDGPATQTWGKPAWRRALAVFQADVAKRCPAELPSPE